ncbi:putative zinc finger motif [Fragilaria crotonensis]|nr:putative zinc finger motif [Fragilaria crotonensis]
MSDTVSSAKETLTEKLADLLGFADGAQDVLEHLLSIESSEDLRAYLSQLLGQDGENVRLFVEDVGKFQRGESLSSATSISQQSVNKATDESGPARQRQENYMEGVKRNDKVQERKTQLNNRKPAPKTSTPSASATKSNTPPPPKPSDTAAKKPAPPQPVKQAPMSTQVNIVEQKITPPTKPLLPIAPLPRCSIARVVVMGLFTNH